MNLGHLTSFMTVASSGSLTSAARALCITQPAVSHHIKALEEQLGVTLFVRHKKGMLLTVEGEELLNACREVIKAADEVSFKVQRINMLKKGRLVIALTSFLSNALTPAFISFKKEYPGVDMVLTFNNTAGVISAMKDNRADLGFACSAEDLPASVRAVGAHSERLILAAAQWHPLCSKSSVLPEDLAGCLFVIRELGTFTRRHVEDWFAGAPLANHIETSRADSVRELVLGGAVSVMPENSVRADLREGIIKVLPAKDLQSSIDCSLYLSTARPLSSAARAFLEVVREEGCLTRGAELADLARPGF